MSLKKAVWRMVNDSNKQFVIKFLTNSDIKKSSLKQYENNLKNFLIWNNLINNDKDLRDIKKTEINKYFNFLIIDEKLKINSIKLKRNILSTFYSFLNKHFPDDFKENIILSTNIDYDMLEDDNDITKIRKKELIFLEKYLYKSGNMLPLIYLMLCYENDLKLIDLCNIKRDIVNVPKNKYGDYIYFIQEEDSIENDTYELYKTKKNKRQPKIIHINEDLMNYIEIYNKSRKDNIDYLFISEKGEVKDRISQSAFIYWCREIFSKILDRDIRHRNLYKKSKR